MYLPSSTCRIVEGLAWAYRCVLSPIIPGRGPSILFDRDHVAVGHVIPQTSESPPETVLEVALSARAREILETTETTARLPARFVDRRERDGLRLRSTIAGLRTVLLGPP